MFRLLHFEPPPLLHYIVLASPTFATAVRPGVAVHALIMASSKTLPRCHQRCKLDAGQASPWLHALLSKLLIVKTWFYPEQKHVSQHHEPQQQAYKASQAGGLRATFDL